MRTAPVSSSGGDYPVIVGAGVAASLKERVHELFPGLSRLGIVSNPVVWSLHGTSILKSLGTDLRTVVALHPDGEPAKHMGSILVLLDRFLEDRWERRDPLLVVGGGVTGDMGGLVAGLLLRGVPLLHLPTTVVAQVDSAIGGKTGVDHPLGKNLIGMFNPPRAVLSDPGFLRTLPIVQRRAGVGEVIKYALIGDRALLSLLTERIEELVASDFHAALWEEVIFLSSSDKAGVVSRDEKESGERMLLNFGHTFGHALEGALGYSGILHGEAVALGMLSAARISGAMGLSDSATFGVIRDLVKRAGLPDSWPAGVAFEAIAPYLGRDKKASRGQVALILPERPGSVRIVRDYDPDLLSLGVFT
jgi:3-dehydroquinate synthase